MTDHKIAGIFVLFHNYLDFSVFSVSVGTMQVYFLFYFPIKLADVILNMCHVEKHRERVALWQWTHLIVGQTGGREDGDLLSAGDGVHTVDSGDTRLDHLLGVDT